MELRRFSVTGFRSVVDSGWIEVGKITALIGTNESGKTNLLLALWKLNPAKEGEIDPIADYPRKRYNEIRNMKTKPVFVSAEFVLTDALVDKLVKLTGAEPDEVRIALVKRKFDGDYFISFPGQKAAPTVPAKEISTVFTEAISEIEALTATKAEESMKAGILTTLGEISQEFRQDSSQLDADALATICARVETIDTSSSAKRSTIAPRLGQLLDVLEEYTENARKPAPTSIQAARDLVLKNLLSFVYYSNYGNLDSEIYLPHVIENMERDNLGSKEAAKTRTLRVLFDFVNLSPQEILELGRDTTPPNREPTSAEIQSSAEKKKEREILLQSASSMLTERFRKWWRQGEYRIRFQADGNHFRIWVSDDRRTEEIELEGRSAGLQWFLSFFLVFLVESLEGHEDSMLLLDEPGHSLHPLAQKDLSDFFESLADTNQLAYTTHSPFLVDPDHLDRVKAVYVDDSGATLVSANLRAGDAKTAQTGSIYPVHAALGLSVSETLLQGCQPVIVEGSSDQYYLSTIKNFLISEGSISPKRELIFMPAGGVKGVAAVVPIVAGKDESLPHVIVDSDEQGRNAWKKLADGLYSASKERLVTTESICGIPGSEVEDLFPTAIVSDAVMKYLRPVGDENFEDTVTPGEPIIPQIEAFAARNNIELKKGWKAELAVVVKNRFQRVVSPMTSYEKVAEQWRVLFKRLLA